MLGADPEQANVNGGAVALGHPIGASGGRIVTTMINELSRNGGGLGLAAICSGGGQGDALLIEVHPNPAEAWSDGNQQVSLAVFAELMQELRPLILASGRE